MRHLIPSIALLTACTPTDEVTTPPPATEIPTPVDLPTPPPTPPASSFRAGTWRVDSLVIVGDTDLDDDGVIDNKLPDVLAAVDLLLGAQDVSLDSVNAGIASNMANDVTVAFIDGQSDGTALQLDVLPGTSDLVIDEALAYDEDGLPRARLLGAMAAERAFEVAGKVTLPVTMLPGLPPSPVFVDGVVFGGELDALGVNALLVGAIPVRSFVDDVIAPVIPPEGYEITPGNVMTREEVLALIENLAPGLADVTLPSGEIAVSAAFEITAVAWTF